MPIYEYTCDGCGANFELLVASHRIKPVCPQCGSKKVKRGFSTFAAHAGGAPAAVPCAQGSCPAAGAGFSPCRGGTCPL